MSSQVSGLHYEENQIGGAFKSSQTEYIWEFIINGKTNKIVLINSKWSGKNRLLKNGVEVFDKKKDGSFLKNFEIDGHIFSILKYGEKYELRIDNQYFNHLYTLEKNKLFFPSEGEQNSKDKEEKKDKPNPEKEENNIFNFKENNKSEKPGILDFKIKIDESKQNSGLKKFKFGAGFNSKIVQSKNIENAQNNQNNNNDNDIFGLGIDNNKEKEQTTNNNNIIDDIFGYGNNNTNNNDKNNNIDFLNFDSDKVKNEQNSNPNIKSNNDQLADVFNAFSQINNNNSDNQKDEKTDKIQNDVNNVASVPSSNNNDNNFGISLPIENNENKEENYPEFNQIINQENNNQAGFGFKFVPQESYNFNNIEGFKPSVSGFNYEAFGNSQKKEPATNNEKLDNKLKDLFK